MKDNWTTDPNLMGAAIDRVVRRSLRTPFERLPDAFQQALLDNLLGGPTPKSPYAVLAGVCRQGVLAVLTNPEGRM